MVTEYIKDEKALVASDNYGPVVKPDTIAAGVDLVKGTVIGRVTASRKMAAYAAGNVDGSEAPVAILLEDAVAALADAVAVIGFAGVYKRGNMVGLDQAAEDALEARGVYFVD